MNQVSFLRQFKLAQSLFSAKRESRQWSIMGRPALTERLEERRLLSLTFSVLDNFTGGNGAGPLGQLVADAAGNLYGTTAQGGPSSNGTVFEVVAGSNTITMLASFNGANGRGPDGELVVDGAGNLFGTTAQGGAHDAGTVFELGRGSGTITTLATFDFTSGADPHGGIYRDSAGNIYGATGGGGPGNNGASGVVFEVVAGSGTVTQLAIFDANNSTPLGGVIADAAGNLYGTAAGSANFPNGTVFELAKGSSTITALASFDGTNGSYPRAGLYMDAAGNLFGTTSKGGAGGIGTFFELAKGSATITALASFDATNGSPAYDGAALIADSAGNLYGTAVAGGAANKGTIFELPNGSSAITSLLSFDGAHGAQPSGGLIEDAAGNFYGTTGNGGTIGYGTFFKLSNGSPTTTTAATIDINGPGTADNIALFNPAGSAEPFRQTVTATITNTGTAQQTFDVSVHPSGAGNVSLDKSSVSLAPGANTLVIITPTAISSSPNDVEIRVDSGGSPIAFADMTVASVTIPLNVYNKDTPYEMLTGGFTGAAAQIAFIGGLGDYRIPPRVQTLQSLIVTPDLGGSGQGVTLSVTGQNDANGTVLIDGTAQENVTSSLLFYLSGVTQTAPGNAGQLKLSVNVAGENTIESTGFSVSAIPQNVSFVMPTKVNFVNENYGLVKHGTFVHSFGFVVHYNIESDSGVLGDLLTNSNAVNPVSVSEQIAVDQTKVSDFLTSPSGVFKDATIIPSGYQSIADMLSPNAYDYHTVPFITVDDPKTTHEGALIVDQTFTFNDTRSGAENIPVANSGFKIFHRASFDSSDPRNMVSFTTLKFGAATSANGFASAAGAGIAVVTQRHVIGSATASSLTSVMPVPSLSPARAKAAEALTPLAVGTTSKLAITTQPPASIAAGAGFGLVVQAEDSTGALTSGYSGTISLQLNNYAGDPSAVLGGTLTVTAVNGVAHFSGLTIDKSGNYSLTATATGLTGTVSNAVSITSLPASGLVVAGPVGNVSTLSPFKILVAATDASGNIDTAFNGMVTLSLSSNPGGATLGGTVSATALNGLATFSGVTLSAPGTGYVLQAAGDNFTAASSSFDVHGDQLAITAQPPGRVAPGVAFGLTVSAENAAGAVDTSYNGIITVALDSSITGPGITLQGPVALKAVNGVATFSGLTMTDLGQFKLVATAANAASAKSQTFAVSAVATQLIAITQPPIAVTAVAPFEVDLAAEDANGNVDTSFSGNVTLELSLNPSTLGGATTVAAVNGIATFTGLTITSAPNVYTLTANSSDLTSFTTSAINILGNGVATHLVVTTQPLTTLTAGATAGLVVKAEDSFGTVDSSFTGPVTVSDPNGKLAGTLSVNAVAGVANFSNVMIDSAGAGQVLFVDATGLVEGQSNAITVNAAPATQASVSGPSQNALAGSVFGFDVFAVDPFGNTDPNYTGGITLALKANPAGGTLGGTRTVNAVAGDASFKNLTLSTVGTGYTLTATGAGLSAGTSPAFDVTADQLIVTSSIGPAVPLLARQTLAVSAENGADVVDTSFTGAVTVSLIAQGNGTGTLGGTLTVNAIAGVATFSDLTVDQTGDYSLLFTASGIGQTQSGEFTVTPRVATTLSLAISSSSVPFGEPAIFTATASSAAGGSTGAGTVTFLSGTTVIGTATVQNDGTAVLAASLLPPGATSVTASFPGSGNFLPSSSSAVSVTVGPQSTAAPSLARFIFPPVVVAGQPIKTNLPVVISNGDADLKGTFTVVLFIDGSPTLDGNQVQVGKVRRGLTLKAGKSTIVPFHVRSLPRTLPGGTDYFLAEIIDPTGATDVAASGALSVQAPLVTLNAVGGAVKPGVIKVKHSGAATVTVTDTGNIDAVGFFTIILSPSSDGATPISGVTLATLHRNLHLRRNRPISFPLRFKVTGALPPGGYSSFFSVSFGAIVTTAVGSSFTAGG